MTFDFTQGDPRLVLDENGADLVIVNGQPVMDQGLENAAFISLWTSEFWGDSVMPDASQRVASTFEEISRQAITVSALQRIQAAGKRALKWLLDDEIAGDVEVKVSNPESSQLSVAVLIEPVSKDEFLLLATNHGSNWIAQRDNPANTRIQ